MSERAGEQPLVRVAIDGAVAQIVLDRPERHNALVPELLDDLRSAVAEVADAEPVRVVVLAGEGRSFSTGGDVAAFAAHEGEELTSYSCRTVGALNDVVLDLLGLDIPVVAAVHGPVTGGSLGLVLAADVVVAGPAATFAPWYVHVGFSPDGGWTALLPRRVGHGRAASWQLLNLTLGAEKALEWGLADEVAEDPRTRALVLARHLAGLRPGALARTKQLLRSDLEHVRSALDAELASFVDQITTPEAREGMTAFLASVGQGRR